MALTSFFKRKKKSVVKKADVVHEAPASVKMSPAAKAAGDKLAGRRIVLTPLVSEKGVDRQAFNQVVFRVSRTATKGQITQAVLEQYGMRPVRVRTMRMHPKRRRRGRSEGFTTMWKKAYVAVKDLKPFNVT